MEMEKALIRALAGLILGISIFIIDLVRIADDGW
jgi:hypothetical protein